MSLVPRVSATTREKVSREFDDRGPAACTKDVLQFLERNNPELLDMALKCAADAGDAVRAMAGFAIFFRLLIVESSLVDGPIGPQPLPRILPETRSLLVRKIDRQGTEFFVHEAVEQLETYNPELLQMAHRFAAAGSDYLLLMQGFALLYQSLALQRSADGGALH